MSRSLQSKFIWFSFYKLQKLLIKIFLISINLLNIIIVYLIFKFFYIVIHLCLISIDYFSKMVSFDQKSGITDYIIILCLTDLSEKSIFIRIIN